MPKRRRKKRYHTGTHSSPKAGDCSYRSGWELQLMQHMDADPTVASYLYEGVEIPYLSSARSGRMRNYWPDFLVTRTDGSQQLIEVKPKRKLQHRVVQKKLAAARQWCSDHGVELTIITEVELKGLGLL
jgi:hypothetical protein